MRPEKWPLNTGDCLIKVDYKTDLTVIVFGSLRLKHLAKLLL